VIENHSFADDYLSNHDTPEGVIEIGMHISILKNWQFQLQVNYQRKKREENSVGLILRIPPPYSIQLEPKDSKQNNTIRAAEHVSSVTRLVDRHVCIFSVNNSARRSLFGIFSSSFNSVRLAGLGCKICRRGR